MKLVCTYFKGEIYKIKAERYRKVLLYLNS